MLCFTHRWKSCRIHKALRRQTNDAVGDYLYRTDRANVYRCLSPSDRRISLTAWNFLASMRNCGMGSCGKAAPAPSASEWPSNSGQHGLEAPMRVAVLKD